MTGERVVRRLAAILAADVVGYSRLMSRDENGTVARLRENRQRRLEPVIARYGGRLVKLMGDGALIEFPSAVDALGAAIEFQQAMTQANQDQPDDSRIVFRIGLHLGDLIVDGDDLYGDGVNVAARLESEAAVGGIVISGAVHEAVVGRLKATFQDLGRLALKNIERPIQAFAISWEPADWTMTTALSPILADPGIDHLSTQRPDRRLAAIVSIDVAGYSRLMGRNESGTLAALKAARRELIDPRIAAHGGRIARTTGDGLIAEFPSVVDAVRCVVEVQTAVAAHDAVVPEDHRISFRIGVNLGELIVDGDNILGEGVNIAGRLQEIAAPGGVCLSGRVHDDIRDLLDTSFADGGAQALKNTTRPIQVWRWSPGAPSPASTTTLALPDKPSIAVLPFQNMSGDAEQEYFADGIVEDITTALSRTGWLLVTGRNTAFTYKGRAVDLRQVGRELGVRYVLEGSIRKFANRVRITSQLIEAASGSHVWADRFDGDLADIFDLQDRITESVVGAIEPTLQRAEIARAAAKPTQSLDAYDLYLRALPLVHVGTRASMDTAVQLLRRALEIDPAYVTVKGYLALVYALREVQSLGEPGEQSIGTALAREVVATDTDDIEALRGAGIALSVLASDRPAAFAALHRALHLNPNSPQVMETLAIVHCHAHDPEPAIRYQKRALQLSPRDPHMGYMLAGLGQALVQANRTAEALPPLQQAVQVMPSYMSGHRSLILALVRLDRLDEARRAAARLLELRPDARVGPGASWVDYVEFVYEMRQALLAAGLPE